MMVVYHHIIVTLLSFITTSSSFHAPKQSNGIHLTQLYQTNAHHQHELLQGMVQFVGRDMINPKTNRFYYYCRPHDGRCEHVHMPLRDLAAVWDATKAIEYLNGQNSEILQPLVDAVKCTLRYYVGALESVQQKEDLSLSEDVLLEPIHIGHSALLLLSACNALKLNMVDEHDMEDIKNAIDGLSRGILSKQLDNGAFCSYYKDKIDYVQGIAFFPGEAILALITAYNCNFLDKTTNERIMSAMLHAFEFYSDYYYNEDVDMNYNIWQVIAFAALYDCLHRKSQKQDEVAGYVLAMCQEICQSKSWKYQLSRGQSFYVNLDTIEIACGLDALAEGIRVAKLQQEIELVTLFERNAANALQFLSWMQSHVPSTCVLGSGGLGYGGICVLEQRLDVTGHAISAMVKLRKLATD